MAAFSTTTTCTNNIFSQQRRHRLSTSFQPIKIRPFPAPLYRGACHGLDHFKCHASNVAVVNQEDDADSIASSSPSTTSSSWTDFAAKVSGEWDGFGADFTVEGNPIELPESVVPDAYREWEVKVFDWQTQCPTLAHCSDTTTRLVYKTIKLLPTVGCEADAATVYTIEQERNIDVDDTTCAFAYQSSSGCYVAVWGFEEKSCSIEVEHCLVDPRDKESRSRVRIIQVLGYQDSEYLRLKGIKVFVEQWYGPFRNGDQLGGCAIRDSAFAATQPLDASLVTGVWQGLTTAVATFHQNVNIQQLIEDRELSSVRDKSIRRNKDDHLVLLPKKLWCSVQKLEDETCCEVGWLLDQGRAITSKCTFSSTTKELKGIAIASETMVS